MEINVKMKSSLQFNAFYLFFIISSIQLGVGMLGSPTYIFAEARQDSWISVIITSIFVIFVLFVMLLILKQYENADILGIQVDIFGKWFGKLLGFVYIVYFASALLSVVITYIEVVQIFLFPEISTFTMGLILLILIIYTVLGGIRVIIGVCFIFFLFPHWLLLLLIEPLMDIDITHFQPVMQASLVELLQGAKASAYTFSGFEILFMLYPFIQNKEKAKLPVILGSLWTSWIILLTTIIVIGFFSADQISRREWSVLGLFKVQTFSFVERFDFVVVAEWMMVVTPNMVLLMWGVTHGMKRLFLVPQKITLYVASALLLVVCIFMDYHFQIQKVTNFISQAGFWLVFVYPFLLLPIVLLKKRWRHHKEGVSNGP
ncbi:GerAB/ArcD/ProY family transporter [Oceanobacillus longus]|uniref:GerAB/ArcD/ProY family transporter n=1 Tax=Oceanobacillus longus TaxID=930120 RepID=A0ABV8GXE8_9BACI